jgi:class 3 adenylate cyclase/tetratricopeptide (TPR) repeat protein
MAPVAPATAAVAPPRFDSPDTYTPRHLAEKILTSRSTLEGERKQVTVLFVDVSGFTALSEHLDPEIVHGLMTRAFELMLAEVHRYEGTVNQFLGDGIMALFGAPIAHEDHARRAVQAALGIRHALEAYQGDLEGERGIRFTVRQGLNAGLVVVGSIGSDLRMDYTAVGDTTNVAARLLQVAEPGRIVISEAVHRLVEDFFQTSSLGELMLKGKTEPVRAWDVVSAHESRSRLDVQAERGPTPLVGRDRELGALLACFEKAEAGQGQVAFIVGEPGIGKSRLIYELRRRVGDRAAWQEGRCVSFAQSIPFYPLVDSLRRSFGIEPADDRQTVMGKIDGGILLLGNELRAMLPYIRHLLVADAGGPGVASMDPQERRAELFAALRRLLLQATAVAPQVVIYEDVHWTDKATEEYLRFVADSVPASRVLLILTFRPGYAHPLGERSYQTRIALSALSAADSAAMAGALVGADDVAAELPALIVRKAEGNPFFLEEVVKSLREAGSIGGRGDRPVGPGPRAASVVPDTIQGVIAARVDRLAEAPKHLLQVASVIGREFSRRLLDRVVDAREGTDTLLHELMALELIHEKRVFPQFEYIFKHVLTQEVTYGSLLGQRRKELHRQIALVIEDLYADRLAEHYEILAHHFQGAEAWDRALDCLLKAADKAARAFATPDALALYDAAEAVAGRMGDGVSAEARMAIHRGRGELHVLLGDFERARREWDRVRTLAGEVGDRHAEGAALVAMGQASALGHQFDQALEDSRQAGEIGEVIGSAPILAGSQLNAAIVYEVTGRLAEARARFEQVIAITRLSKDAPNEAMALVWSAELQGWEGNHQRAAELYEEGIRLARAHNVLMAVLEGLLMSGINLTAQGAYDRAMTTFQDGLALTERLGDENYPPRFLNSLGWLYLECGDLERARELNQRAAEGGRKRGDHESFANAELNLADIALMRGDLALARNYLEDVHRLVEDPATSGWMRWRYSLHLFASLGDLALARGDAAAARAHATEAMEQANRTWSRKYLVKGWRLRGEVALSRGEWDEAERELRQASAVAEAIDSPAQLWRTYAALGRLRTATGREDRAHEDWWAARRAIQRVLDELDHPGLRASLASSPLVRQVWESAQRR